MSKTLTLIISLVILLLLILGMFLVYTLRVPNYPKNNITISNITLDTIISEQHISFLLNEMGAYRLKSYNGNPKIQVEVDKEKFNTEIRRGIIITKKGEISDADIKIITTKQEVIPALQSNTSMI